MCTAVLVGTTVYTLKCNTKQVIIFTDNNMLLQTGRNIGYLSYFTFPVINNSGHRMEFEGLLNLALQIWISKTYLRQRYSKFSLACH